MYALLSLLLLATTLPIVDLAPLQSLSSAREQGQIVIVVGRVLDADGSPVANAEVYAYHADSAGKYHDDAYRGSQRTDRSGRYRFYTLRPGTYGPPPHIHFVVNAGARPEIRPTLRFTDGSRAPRRVLAGGKEADEYTFDISWSK